MKKICIPIFVFWLMASCAFAATDEAPKNKSVSLEVLRRIPILESGRIKPLDTYAETVLLQFSGRKSVDKKDAIHWLAQLLITPDTTRNDKIFLINNPEVAFALDMAPEAKRRYSFAQLEKAYHRLSSLAVNAFQIEEKKRTPVESEFIRLYDNLHLYLGLSNNFQFALAQHDFEITNNEVKKRLGLPVDKTQFSFLEIALSADAIEKLTQDIQDKDVKTWTPIEKNVVQLLAHLYQWSNSFQDMPLTVIAPVNSGEEKWLSPWDAISTGFQNSEVRREIILLADFAASYKEGNQAKADLSVNSFIESINRRMKENKHLRFINLEVLYNKLNLFSWAQLFYFLSFIFTVLSLIKTNRFYYRFGFSFVLAGLWPHVTALAMRVLILGRPPVSSLYETFIFVSFMAVVFGVLVELTNKKQLGLLVAGICGSILLIIAGKFSAEGDTMKMLVAVLNSNFWLSIHVLHITTGYAACCVAGVLGHIYLLQALFNPKDKKALDVTYRYVVGVLGLGLTVTVFGTALGGVWADQSWGRFWGWDPKENGALLIVLWCAIIFHARVARFINPLGFVTGSALVLSVVMWAWFGVNLLSVGLHSYGFTSGISTNLIIFYTLEALFLLISVPIVYEKLK